MIEQCSESVNEREKNRLMNWKSFHSRGFWMGWVCLFGWWGWDIVDCHDYSCVIWIWSVSLDCCAVAVAAAVCRRRAGKRLQIVWMADGLYSFDYSSDRLSFDGNKSLCTEAAEAVIHSKAELLLLLLLPLNNVTATGWEGVETNQQNRYNQPYK